MKQGSKRPEVYPGGDFFDNINLLVTLDVAAQRYGVLPTDLLRLSLYEFSLNIAIMVAVLEDEKKAGEKQSKPADWSAFGMKHEVKK